MSRFLRLAFLAAASLAPGAVAAAEQINTGEPNGPYHTTFCPALSAELAKSKFDYACATSAGSGENLDRVAGSPRQIGFAQLDVFTLEAPKRGGAGTFERVRTDDARECVFAVTRAREIRSYADITANAGKLRFILPPANSGSAGTFRFIQSVDPEGLAKAGSTVNAASTEEAIKLALSADDTVAVFVQFPDPGNERFKLIAGLDGRVLPVLDRTILRQQIGGQKVYYASETQITHAKWTKKGQKLVTACTPLVVFTGSPERAQGDKAAQDQRDLIRTLQAIPATALLPQEGEGRKLLARTKELSADSVEKLLAYYDRLKVEAKPWIDRAKDMGKRAMEQAGPALEEAKKAGKKAFEEAKARFKELMDKATRPKAPDAPQGGPAAPVAPPAQADPERKI